MEKTLYWRVIKLSVKHDAVWGKLRHGELRLLRARGEGVLGVGSCGARV